MTALESPFDRSQTDALLTSTRAVRRRLDLERPVEPQIIEECLEIALQAPIGGNIDCRRWLIVTEDHLKSEIGEVYRRDAVPYLDGLMEAAREAGDAGQERVAGSALFLAQNLERVPVLVIPCIEPAISLDNQANAAGAYGSILPAVWSFQLALRSRGLGSAWTTLHLGHEDRVAELLAIPASASQVALLPVAYTKGVDFRSAQRPPVHKVAYWNGWLNTRTV